MQSQEIELWPSIASSVHWKTEYRSTEKKPKVVKCSTSHTSCTLLNDPSVYYYEVNAPFKELWWNCKTLKTLINFSLKHAACPFCLKHFHYHQYFPVIKINFFLLVQHWHIFCIKSIILNAVENYI